MKHAHVTLYLRALALLAIECADRPWLWPTFLRILRLVPGTVAELQGDARRMAA